MRTPDAKKETEQAIKEYINYTKSPCFDGDKEELEKALLTIVKGHEEDMFKVIKAVEAEHHLIIKHIPDYRPRLNFINDSFPEENQKAKFCVLPEGAQKEILKAKTQAESLTRHLQEAIRHTNTHTELRSVEIFVRDAAVFQGKLNVINAMEEHKKEPQKDSTATHTSLKEAAALFYNVAYIVPLESSPAGVSIGRHPQGKSLGAKKTNLGA